MKKLVLFLLLIISAVLSAKTQPGKSSLAAGLTELGKEFGFGRMVSSSGMLLLDGSISFESTSEESLYGDQSSDGPQTDAFHLTLYPEYRIYLLPQAKATPYFGVHGVLGIGSTSSEEPTTGNITTTVTNGSSFTIGIGASFGVEYFLNSNVSLSAHARLAQFAGRTTKTETDNGFNLSEFTEKSTTISVELQPALYIRIYF